MPSTAHLIRRLCALAVLFISFWWWSWQGPTDVIDLIVNWKPVLFNRYSQGHFGVLLLLTPLLWAVAAALWNREPLHRSLANTAIMATTTLVALLAFTYLAHFLNNGPRYVETAVEGDSGHTETVGMTGVVRHRPPNERYELIWEDQPEHPRSYPDAPPGYGAVPIVLTTDERGFRNPRGEQPHYDIVAVGDSFVAGSHVSDAEGWTELLQDLTGKQLYNLGVSGAGPRTYLNNFMYYGTDLKPAVAFFMIYEGNDFKEEVATQAAPDENMQAPLSNRLGEHFRVAFKSSPVTRGLDRLSLTVFEQVGAGSPVPGFAEQVGFMPVRVAGAKGEQFYAFTPKRLLYLNVGREAFASSPAWQATRDIMTSFAELCREHGIRPVFLYAPSAPHVVLPLAAESIPADQLRHFLAYGRVRLAKRDADQLREEVFAKLDNQEAVFM
ncbi:MAG: hypothetical protein RBS88_10630, partial [Spongiibacteraceae bacterium]|nr:hypothetical protein [Spongiibacteraceae bacterium]